MYRGRIPQSILSPQPNLKKLLLENTSGRYSYTYTLMIRQKFMDFRKLISVGENLQSLIKKAGIYKTLQRHFEAAPRKQSANILRVWAHQCECVVAQRLRRCQQMFSMYSNLWEERALKEFMRKMRLSIAKRSKDFVLGAIGVSVYNWDTNRIPDNVLREHFDEFEYVYKLKERTMCLSCKGGAKKPEESDSVVCDCGSPGKADPNKTFDDWVPFIEKRDLLVWRRLHASGVYEYKVYGSYHDVSAEDFLNVQIDMDFRRKWDNTAVILEVAETDPLPDSNSDIVYWEMLWPRLFVNRDYVFNRRYVIDEETKKIVIYSTSTEHPDYPKRPDKYRIEDYWSCMVIKPYEEMHAPGVEFTLTYYDNPGVNIPSTVTTWVAMRAMPDYLERLRDASKDYRLYCREEGKSKQCEMKRAHDDPDEFDEREELEYCSNKRRNASNKNDWPEFSESETRGESVNTKKDEVNSDVNSTTAATVMQKDTSSFWKYLRPTYYFH